MNKKEKKITKDINIIPDSKDSVCFEQEDELILLVPFYFGGFFDIDWKIIVGFEILLIAIWWIGNNPRSFWNGVCRTFMILKNIFSGVGFQRIKNGKKNG